MTTKPLRRTAIFRLFNLLVSGWPLGLYKVSGQSMEPSLRDGDLVVGWKRFRPKVGDVVVAQTLERLPAGQAGPLVKRVVRMDGDHIWLEGDNTAASTDSRQLGHFLPGDIVAKKIAKF